MPLMCRRKKGKRDWKHAEKRSESPGKGGLPCNQAGKTSNFQRRGSESLVKGARSLRKNTFLIMKKKGEYTPGAEKVGVAGVRRQYRHVVHCAKRKKIFQQKTKGENFGFQGASPDRRRGVRHRRSLVPLRTTPAATGRLNVLRGNSDRDAESFVSAFLFRTTLTGKSRKEAGGAGDCASKNHSSKRSSQQVCEKREKKDKREGRGWAKTKLGESRTRLEICNSEKSALARF